MTIFLLCIVFALTLFLLISLLYVLRAPSYVDCLLSTLLVGTIGVAILSILSIARDLPNLLDVALILALLTSITLVTFTQFRGNRL